MRAYLISAALVLTTVMSANASDVIYAQDNFDNRWDFTGVQIGLEAGYTWASDKTLQGPCFNAECAANAENRSLGVYAGYNHQFDKFVVGAEAAFRHHGAEFDDASGVSIDTTVTLAAKAGVAIDRFMAYGFVGAVYGNTKADAIPPLNLPENWTGSDWGLTYGVGVDVLITERFVAGIKYQRQEYDTFNDLPIDATINEVVLRGGVKF
ncbi:MAG: outer membrane beta-barrel protein [Pseudomonadota bacterium]